MFADNNIVVYPNPADQGSTINIQYVVVNFPEGYSGETELSIYSVDGRIVYQDYININETKQSLIKLNDNFAPGCYTIRTKFANTRFVVK